MSDETNPLVFLEWEMFQWWAGFVIGEPLSTHKHWAGTQDGSVDTSFSISLFNDIIFHFLCKENTITQSSESKQAILQQIPGLLGGIIIELQSHMMQSLKMIVFVSISFSLCYILRSTLHTAKDKRHYNIFTGCSKKVIMLQVHIYVQL